jgi:hypothetical protein
MDTDEKVRENYCRRWAKRLGLHLSKDRARHWNLDHRGGYQIIEPYQNIIMWGERWELTLDDVERIFEEYEKKLSSGSTR